jgi:hypothetical protein
MEQKTSSMQEGSPSMMPQELELQAAAMRVKLQQNREAQQQQGIQSAAEQLQQLKAQTPQQ